MGPGSNNKARCRCCQHKRTHMTQREKIAECVKKLSEMGPASPEVTAVWVELEDAIAAAQNRPPLGVADGSVDEKYWYKARDFSNAYCQLMSKFQDIS